jgi:hypothetical protein
MRTMEIRPFAGAPIQNADLGSLVKSLADEEVLTPEQALALVGYMAWPNDSTARSHWLDVNQAPFSRPAFDPLARKLKLIQQHWARVADIVHNHYDLDGGQHQKARGGASVGKAIALIDANAKSKGTGAAKLWGIWKSYKDVAHLITAAVSIAREAQQQHRMAPCGLKLHQFQPYRVAMLLPDLVISVAISVERYGLQFLPQSRSEPMFDPETLWHIPADINLHQVELPARKMTKDFINALNERRAGNRGTANRPKTTPVLD